MTAHSGVRYQRAGRFVFSSFGARYRWNKDFDKEYLTSLDAQFEGPSYNTIELFTSFFGDKVTFSLGFSEGATSIGDDSLAVRIGLSGLEKFFSQP